MIKKTLSMFCALIMLFSLSVPAFAANNEESTVKQVTIPQGRAVDTSFTLDFDESEMWVLDFTNDDAFFNHKELKVKMGSVRPDDPEAQVEIELRVYDPAAGKYVPPKGEEISVNFIPGQIEIFKLPFGATAKDYRLIFWRLTDTISTAEFTVISDESFKEIL
ncbi:hypothetical protein [Flavonifractor sp. An306]|uniref:hypothetical protein n=1 Tax=Flavonifractor sp. An306 TaxID=1965629 RepID=UPI00174C51B8|nr:hypothetical protein [Flavonifractor sp. An306]